MIEPVSRGSSGGGRYRPKKPSNIGTLSCSSSMLHILLHCSCSSVIPNLLSFYLAAATDRYCTVCGSTLLHRHKSLPDVYAKFSVFAPLHFCCLVCTFGVLRDPVRLTCEGAPLMAIIVHDSELVTNTELVPPGSEASTSRGELMRETWNHLLHVYGVVIKPDLVAQVFVSVRNSFLNRGIACEACRSGEWSEFGFRSHQCDYRHRFHHAGSGVLI